MLIPCLMMLIYWWKNAPQERVKFQHISCLSSTLQWAALYHDSIKHHYGIKFSTFVHWLKSGKRKCINLCLNRCSQTVILTGKGTSGKGTSKNRAYSYRKDHIWVQWYRKHCKMFECNVIVQRAKTNSSKELSAVQWSIWVISCMYVELPIFKNSIF